MRIPSFPPSGLCHQFYPSCKFYPFFQQCNWQIKIRSSEKVPGKSRPLKSMKNQPLTTCITLSPLICYLFPPVTCQYSWQILSLMIGLKNIRKILEKEINGSSCVLWQLFSFICRLFWSILKVAWLCVCTQGLLRMNVAQICLLSCSELFCWAECYSNLEQSSVVCCWAEWKSCFLWIQWAWHIITYCT